MSRYLNHIPTALLVAGALTACNKGSKSPNANANTQAGNPPQARTEGKPNVIILYTDDQGTIDVNCYGAKDLHTPNMDKLAATGTMFTQFYAASPVCSPSRAALLTGKTPYKAGLADNASSEKGHEGGLPGQATTIAEALKAHGYTTGHVGKWHVGYTEASMPNAQGFDYSFGHMGGCIDNYSHYFYWNGPNRHDLWRNGKEVWHDGEYFPDLMDKEAQQFITQNQDKPFFLYYAINMPHYPLQATSKWRQHYKDMPMPRKAYAAFVSTIDERIGRLMDLLEKNGLRDNTIIILQSDHGHSTEERTYGGGGNAGPYRGAKFSVFEGGLRVPAIVSYPKGMPQNQTRNQMASNIDWFPTILDYCGIGLKQYPVEGKSLKGVINDNAETPHDYLVWKYAHQWAVRQGDYKVMYKPIDPSREDRDKFWWSVSDSLYLVNLKQDTAEANNLFEQNPEKAAELKAIYDAWLKTNI